jgi:hypothetical protein
MGTIKKWLFMNAPNLDTYHPPEYDGYDEPTCQFVADNFDQAVLGQSWQEWNDYTTIIKNLNPSCQILNYIWIHSAGPHVAGSIPEAPGCSWDDIKYDEDYFLHNQNGERIRCGTGVDSPSLTDPNSRKWRDCFIARMDWDLNDPNYGQPIDGWHIDEPLTAGWLLLNTGCENPGWNITPDDPIVKPPDGAPDCSGLLREECINTEGCYWNGSTCVTMTRYDIWQKDMFRELKQTFSNKIVSPNMREHLYSDVTMAHEYEGPLHTYWWNLYHGFYSPGHCQEHITQLEQESNRGIQVRWGPGTKVPYSPTPEELIQLRKVFLGCLSGFLMGMNPDYSYFSFNYQRTRPNYGYWSEMDLNIGRPKGPYQSLEQEGPYTTLYVRDFDGGRVAVNFSQHQEYTINIEGETVTLGPGDSYIPPDMNGNGNGETQWGWVPVVAGVGTGAVMAYVMYKTGMFKGLSKKLPKF